MDFIDTLLQGSSNTNGQAVVSGTNVIQEPEEEFDLDALMSDINSSNVTLQQQQDEEAEAVIQAAEDADRKAREEARAKNMAEKAEAERLERERILAAEEEEARRLAEEQAARQQANPLNKLTGFFTKPKKTKDADVISEMQETDNSSTLQNDNVKQEEEQNITESVSAKTAPVTEQITESVDIQANATSAVNIPSASDKEDNNSSVTVEQPKNQIKNEPKNGGGIFGGFVKNNKLLKQNSKSGKQNNGTKEKKTESPKKQSEQNTPDFEYLATHDSLTKLLNRTAFDMKMGTVSSEKLTVIFFDINNLKKTNDTLGHEFGNRLITATASKLAELFPDCVYRIGGDEFIVLAENLGSKVVEKRIEIVREYLKKKTAEDTDGVIYAIAAGYAIGDGKKTIMELQEEADKAMYADKAKYKKEHPEQNGRPEENTTQPVNYDELLSKEQRELKEIIREGHVLADEDRTDRIFTEIQSRYQEVLAIFIADVSFDALYIIRDVRNFLTMASEFEDMIDYSYFYVVYEGGPQYYGADDYMMEITHLFEEITNNLKYNRSLNSKEIAKIPGINIFKNIYFDC